MAPYLGETFGDVNEGNGGKKNNRSNGSSPHHSSPHHSNPHHGSPHQNSPHGSTHYSSPGSNGSTQDNVAHSTDVLLRGMPKVDTALGDFNALSVMADRPPNRDVPSILITHLTRPDVLRPEPDWAKLLSYFLGPHANHGMDNLQDLLVLLVRVILPRVIITNRRYLRFIYNRNSSSPKAPTIDHLRYDNWPQSSLAGMGPNNISIVVPEDPKLFANSMNSLEKRPIFRSIFTPMAEDFKKWLEEHPLCDDPAQSMPGHRVTEIDTHLNIPEEYLRGLRLMDLLRQTIRVLNIFWWISYNNTVLARIVPPNQRMRINDN